VQNGEGVVELRPCSDPAHGPLCGRIVWLRDARNPDGSKTSSVDDVTDVLNADPTLRQRKLLGMFGMYDFRYGPEPNSFEGGFIYDPQKGQTYRATVRLLPDDKLYLHGYVGFSASGRRSGRGHPNARSCRSHGVSRTTRARIGLGRGRAIAPRVRAGSSTHPSDT